MTRWSVQRSAKLLPEAGVWSGLASYHPQDISQDEDLQLVHNLFVVLSLCYIPFILLSNTVVFWATILHPALQTTNNLLLCSLSLADFLVGILTIPMYALAYLKDTKDTIYFNKHACLFWFASSILPSTGSLWHLLTIAIDRYIAVMFPLQYKSIVTLTRMKIVVIVLWTYIVLVAFTPMMGWNNYDPTIPYGAQRCNFYLTLPPYYVWWAVFGTIFVCISIPLLIYLRIVFVIIKQAKIYKTTRASGAHTNVDVSHFRQRAISTKITAALMFLFILLWTPYLFVAPLRYIYDFEASTQKKLDIIQCMTQLLYFANSMVNAPIYANGKAEYKETYDLMLRTYPWRWKEKLHDKYLMSVARRLSRLKIRSKLSLKRGSSSTHRGFRISQKASDVFHEGRDHHTILREFRGTAGYSIRKSFSSSPQLNHHKKRSHGSSAQQAPPVLSRDNEGTAV